MQRKAKTSISCLLFIITHLAGRKVTGIIDNIAIFIKLVGGAILCGWTVASRIARYFLRLILHVYHFVEIAKAEVHIG